MQPGFSPAVIENTTTIKVGYMTKPCAVAVRTVPEGLFLHVANNERWFNAAVCHAHRSQHPLKCNTFLHGLRKRAAQQVQERDSQEPKPDDPMESLDADGSALAELRTPPKRARHRLGARHSAEKLADVAPTDVRVVDVLRDINVFPRGERPTIEQASIRVLCSPSSGKGGPMMIHVWVGHVEMLVSLIATLVSRFGVPLADLPDDSALAEAPQWFDISTNRWHLRRDGTGEVVVSDPVPRLGLSLTEFTKAKADALESLTSRS